jgi:hypothetical protein
LGGYHPSFHHDGYPQVPRLGFNWSIGSAIVIKGEIYFALTSEAVMAGGKLTASAHFGPAWAEVIFGADGIVYFDPFRFEVEIYASISAGITIDVWIGEITISISLGAKIMVAGPSFHGRAEFDVGPVSLAVEFGDSNQSAKVYLTWEQFVTKYLEAASPGVARVLTAIPGKGTVPPGTKAGGTTETGTADGSAEKPFEVFAEFEITVTTTVPTQFLNMGGVDTEFVPSHILGIAPVNVNSANSRLVLTLSDSAAADHLPTLLSDPNTNGSFPIGVWGPPQPDNDKKVPAGDVVQALDSVRFEAVASLQGTLPGPVKYNQVEIGPRKPLPFPTVQAYRPGFLVAANALSALLPAANSGPATFAIAKPWLSLGGHSNTAVKAIERERSAPPRLGSLTQDLAPQELPKASITLTSIAVTPPVNHTVMPPRAIAILSPPVVPELPNVRTTVSTAANASRIAAPTLQGVQSMFALAVPAKLLRVPGPASAQASTLVSAGAIPLTRIARSNTAAIGSRGAPADAANRLKSLTASLASAAGFVSARVAAPEPLRAGEIAVLQLPNANRDANSKLPRPLLIVQGAARVVAFSHGGTVLWDGPGSPNGVAVPRGTERIAVLALGDSTAEPNGLSGWHSHQELPYIGWSCALAAGAVVYAEGGSVPNTDARFRAGWARATELVTGTTIVETRFTSPASAVVILIDDPVDSEAARGLSLTLHGADRAGTSSSPVPPTIVVVGNRSVLIYPIVMKGAPIGAVPGPFTVSVMSQDGWHLAGVMAANDTPKSLALRFSAAGPDSLVQPLIRSRTGPVTVHWGPSASPAPTGGN